ncbi:hypothetical protein KC19_6G149200, partial [Ceratodon purpureus]
IRVLSLSPLDVPASCCRCSHRAIISCRESLPSMGHEAVWNSHPKGYGPGSRTCRVCGNSCGMIRKYGINTCRQCFRIYSKDIGFVKYR